MMLQPGDDQDWWLAALDASEDWDLDGDEDGPDYDPDEDDDDEVS